ncbi:MFS transporter [Plantactinospora sonchi]|uniref:MFS transporter n=1 Tax=Plantactinospora sonchi TaxID=1544735 RepID=A0ABU7S0N6_9ACTN
MSSSSAPARQTTRASLLLLAYLAFVSLGLPDGLLGVGWPSIRSEFTVPTEAVGLLLTSGTVGYLVSSVVAGFSIARLGVGWLLAGSTALASLALTGYASSPALPVMIGCALLLGLGSGAIDAGLNAYAAGAFGPRHMNWMHACFGLGVAIGPLVMTTALSAGLSWRWGYGVVAGAQAVLALAFVLTAGTWTSRRPVDGPPGHPADPATADPATVLTPPLAEPTGEAGRQEEPAVRDASATGPTGGPVRIRETLAIPAVWFGALTFAMYVAIEVAAGLWAFLLLTEARGMTAATAGLCVSLYWGSLFVGRVVQGVLAERLGTRLTLLGSMVGMLVGAGLLAVPGPGWLAVTGLAVLGFGAAPVFPLLTLTTADRVGRRHADRAIGVQIGAAALGGALIPAGLGVLIGRTSVAALGPALVVAAIVMLVLYWASRRPGPTGVRPGDTRDAGGPGPRPAS